MVELSDNGDLMRRFVSLSCLRMFMYGEQNEGLSYLPKFRKNGVSMAKARVLDDRPATTHWTHARELQTTYPKIEVEEDRLFIVHSACAIR